MRHLTQAELAHIKARSFAHIVASIGAAADRQSHLGQRDRTRRGTLQGDLAMVRRQQRRDKASRQSLFFMRAALEG